ncbi:MAG: helix-turn-helix transcriptional regulator [Oscillospiraceae bacterium]|nr:helix-turn-helix transcriptional regulator [Oscillospiraceae bacterium]
MKRNLLAGQPDALPVLKLLRRAPLYGSEIVATLEAAGDRRFAGREAMLYPLLYSLARQGLVRWRRGEESVGHFRRNRWELTGRGRKLVAGVKTGEQTPPPDEAPPRADGTEAAARNGVPDEAPPEAGVSDFERWVEQALRSQRYPPLRRRLKNDLLAHYISRRIELPGAKSSRESGDDPALEALGDPEALGRALRELYPPALSWVLAGARLLLLLALAFLVLMLRQGNLSAESLGFMSEQTLRSRVGLEKYNQPEYESARQLIARCSVRFDGEGEFGPWKVSCEDPIYELAYQRLYTKEGKRLYYEQSDLKCLLMLRFSAAPWHRLEWKTISEAIHLYDASGQELQKSDYPDYSLWRPTYEIIACEQLRPGQSVVVISLNYLWNLKQKRNLNLELCLRQQGRELRFPVELGSWRVPYETFPIMDDDPEALRRLTLRDLSDWNRYGFAVEAKAVAQRPLTAAETDGADGGAPRLLWGTQTAYRNAEEEGTIVECGLLLPAAPTAEQSNPYAAIPKCSLKQPASDPDGEKETTIVYKESSWYREGCLLRLSWPGRSDVSGYELTYRDPESGKTRTLRLNLGEEAAP